MILYPSGYKIKSNVVNFSIIPDVKFDHCYRQNCIPPPLICLAFNPQYMIVLENWGKTSTVISHLHVASKIDSRKQRVKWWLPRLDGEENGEEMLKGTKFQLCKINKMHCTVWYV